MCCCDAERVWLLGYCWEDMSEMAVHVNNVHSYVHNIHIHVLIKITVYLLLHVINFLRKYFVGLQLVCSKKNA